MRKFIIHAGFHKTGSTSIQHTFANNRQELKAKNYIYPRYQISGVTFYNKTLPLYGQYTAKPELFKHFWLHNNVDISANCKRVEETLDELALCAENVVVSDEFFSWLKVSELENAKREIESRGYQVEVISIVRDPGSNVNSAVQQWSRDETIEDILDSNMFIEQCQRVKGLMDVFGSNSKFYSFEEACAHNKGPAGFVFDLIGVKIVDESTLKLNEAMSEQSVRFLDFLNQTAPRFVGSGRLNSLRKKNDLNVIEKIPGDKFYLCRQELDKVDKKIKSTRLELNSILKSELFVDLPSRSSFAAVWGDKQIDFVFDNFYNIDLLILLKVREYISIESYGHKVSIDKIELFDERLRSRLDREVELFDEMQSSSLDKKVSLKGSAVLFMTKLMTKFKQSVLRV